MQPTVILCTKDIYLARKIALELGEDGDLRVLSSPEEIGTLCAEDLLLWDEESFGEEAIPEGAVLLTEEEHPSCKNRTLPLPLPIGAVRKLVSENRTEETARLLLKEDERSARLDGKKILFSDCEFALLTLLYRANGQAVSRERIAKEVFSEENSASLINVYIHYLREKLEFGGEKIIHAERGSGYRIDRRFLPDRTISSAEKEESVCRTN